MRLSFYVACTMSFLVNAIQLDSHAQVEDGLSAAIEMDPEFDAFMYSQTNNYLDIADKKVEAKAKTEAAKIQAKQKVADAKAKASSAKVGAKAGAAAKKTDAKAKVEQKKAEVKAKTTAKKAEA